jgi:hypothetical protein
MPGHTEREVKPCTQQHLVSWLVHTAGRVHCVAAQCSEPVIVSQVRHASWGTEFTGSQLGCTNCYRIDGNYM